jgi:hypothetical protein
VCSEYTHWRHCALTSPHLHPSTNFRAVIFLLHYMHNVCTISVVILQCCMSVIVIYLINIITCSYSLKGNSTLMWICGAKRKQKQEAGKTALWGAPKFILIPKHC